MADIRVGQLWRDESGYLYKIVTVNTQDPEWVYARHPNAKGGLYQILRAWFDEPTWTLVRDTQVAAASREP